MTLYVAQDGTIIEGEAKSLPVIMVNYTRGIAEKVGEARTIQDAERLAAGSGHKCGRNKWSARLHAGGFSLDLGNGEMLTHFIAVPSEGRA